MKLNKTEINVLARTLSDEIFKELSARNKKLLETYKPTVTFKNLEKKLTKVQDLIKEISEITGYTPYIAKNETLEKYKRKELNLFKIPSYPEIEDKIILSQIECHNLDSIIEKVKSSYIL